MRIGVSSVFVILMFLPLTLFILPTSRANAAYFKEGDYVRISRNNNGGVNGESVGKVVAIENKKAVVLFKDTDGRWKVKKVPISKKSIREEKNPRAAQKAEQSRDRLKAEPFQNYMRKVMAELKKEHKPLEDEERAKDKAHQNIQMLLMLHTDGTIGGEIDRYEKYLELSREIENLEDRAYWISYYTEALKYLDTVAHRAALDRYPVRGNHPLAIRECSETSTVSGGPEPLRFKSLAKACLQIDRRIDEEELKITGVSDSPVEPE